MLLRHSHLLLIIIISCLNYYTPKLINGKQSRWSLLQNANECFRHIDLMPIRGIIYYAPLRDYIMYRRK